jgi:hypothetical protein
MKDDWSDLPMQRRMVFGFCKLLEAAVNASLILNYNSIPLSRHPLDLDIPNTGYTTIKLYFGIRDYLSALSLHLMRGRQPQMLRVTLVSDIECEPTKHRAYFEVMIDNEVMLFNESTDYSGTGGENKALLDGLFTVLCDTYQVGIESNTLGFEQEKSAEDFIISEQVRQRT